MSKDIPNGVSEGPGRQSGWVERQTMVNKACFAEGWDLVVKWIITTWKSSLRGSDSFFWPPGPMPTCSINTHTETTTKIHAMILSVLQ